MGFLDKLRGELIDIVEWIDDSRHTLVWRFPRYNNEIKNGAQLIVRPGQKAIFVDRGQIADVFDPGMYRLATENLPLLSTLRGWKHGFESPFKSEVYFVSTRQVTDLKWGTPNPIMMRDADFGPIRLRAFGSYVLQATDPTALLNELVGADGVFETEEITELLRSMINTAFADLISSSNIAALDLASNYQELSGQLRQAVVEKVDDEYGLDIPQLFIINISFPEEVERALDKRTSMGVIGDMARFQQFQMGSAMLAAADNPSGGGAADGMGMGMGLAMANQMVHGMGAAGGATSPPPLPPVQAAWHVAENGATTGPFSDQQIREMIASRRLTSTTLVWCAGMSGWLAADQTGLAAVLGPPPLPPT